MTVCFKTLVLTWLLQLTANNAQTTGLNRTEGQMTTKNASSPFLQDSYSFTPSITAKTLLPNHQTAGAPSSSTLSQLNLLRVSMKTITKEQIQGRGTAMRVVTTLAINPTTSTMVTPIRSDLTQGQNTGKTSTFQLPSDKMSQMSTRPTISTQPDSTTTTATKPTNNKSASPVPNQRVVTSSSTTVKKNPFKQITKTKKVPREKDGQFKEGPNHGKIVAGLIGGALIVMMLGFLFIFVKKRRLQKQQITTTDWAGPSPFLDGAAENGMISQMPSNQLSLGTFLSQRLSKRLTLLPETELDDMMGDFTDKHQGITFGQEIQSSDVQESNRTAAGVPNNKSTEDGEVNPVSVTSSQTNNEVTRTDNAEAASHPTVSESVESAFMQLDDLK